MVPGTRVPFANSLFLVTSTVFMHVVIPIVKYDWAAPPATPPMVAAIAGASPRLFEAKYATSEDVNIRIAPLVVASMTAYFCQLIDNHRIDPGMAAYPREKSLIRAFDQTTGQHGAGCFS